MHRLSARFLILLLVALGLAACHKSPQEKLIDEGATPQAAIESAIGDVRHGDFDRLRQHLLPPDDYQSLRDAWAEQHRHATTATTVQRRRFADLMRELTEPDAKKKQFARFEPKLDAWETKGKRQVAMGVGVMRIMFDTRITQSKTLQPAQKKQLRDVLAALAEWAGNTDWGNKDKAHEAIDVAVDTARKLDVKTLDDVNALDYEQTMQRYGTLWKGARKMLATYGLSLNDVLDSAKVEVIDKQEDKAIVKVDYMLLDKPVSSTFEMVRKGKRWYAADALAWWHRQQARLADAGSTARAQSIAPATSTAPAGTASVD